MAARSKKKPRISEFQKKIEDSGEIIGDRIERHRVYARRASVALSSMIVAAFTVYWTHFTTIHENKANVIVTQTISEIKEIDNKIRKAKYSESDLKLAQGTEKIDLPKLIEEKREKEEFLSKTLKIYKENPLLLSQTSISIYYHIQICLIIISIWIIIGILVIVYFYHMKEMQKLDNLRLAYDRILLIYKLKAENSAKEIGDILKRNDFLPLHTTGTDVSFFPKLLSIFKK